MSIRLKSALAAARRSFEGWSDRARLSLAFLSVAGEFVDFASLGGRQHVGEGVERFDSVTKKRPQDAAILSGRSAVVIANPSYPFAATSSQIRR